MIYAVFPQEFCFPLIIPSFSCRIDIVSNLPGRLPKNLRVGFLIVEMPFGPYEHPDPIKRDRFRLF